MNCWTNDLAMGLPDLAQATSLFNQQLWCWGQDIRRPDGNRLVLRGVQRFENPNNDGAGSIYRIDLTPTSRIILRGFGVFCGDDRWGGVFVRRFGFAPQLTPEPDLTEPPWLADDLPPLVAPRPEQRADCQQLLLTLIDWIRQYEVWIAEQGGVGYRSEMLLDWNSKHGAIVPAEEMMFAWRMLGVAVSDFPHRFIATAGVADGKADRRC